MAEKTEKGKEKKVKKPTALKRDEQSVRRNMRNRAFKSQVLSAVRGLEDALSKKHATNTKSTLNQVCSLMDKGVKKGIYKQNKASRVKSRLSVKAKQLSA